MSTAGAKVLVRVLRERTPTIALAGTALGAALIGPALEGVVLGVETTNPFASAVVARHCCLAVFPARRPASVDPMVSRLEHNHSV